MEERKRLRPWISHEEPRGHSGFVALPRRVGGRDSGVEGSVRRIRRNRLGPAGVRQGAGSAIRCLRAIQRRRIDYEIHGPGSGAHPLVHPRRRGNESGRQSGGVSGGPPFRLRYPAGAAAGKTALQKKRFQRNAAPPSRKAGRRKVGRFSPLKDAGCSFRYRVRVPSYEHFLQKRHSRGGFPLVAARAQILQRVVNPNLPNR